VRLANAGKPGQHQEPGPVGGEAEGLDVLKQDGAKGVAVAFQRRAWERISGVSQL
jgi:hypothetical protein